MVNTLRITSVVAVLVAAVLLVLVAGPKSLVPKLLAKFAMGSDEEVDRILSAPSVVDRYRDDQGNKSVPDVTPALIKQAEIFANILNPPEPAPTSARGKTARTSRNPKVVKPGPSSAKFGLVGTTYLASDPEMSFAYIRLADDTHQWLRKGDEVGHLKVKEIKSGSIICSDGHGDVEMATEPVPETANVLEAGGASAVQTEQADRVPVRDLGDRITGPPVPRPWAPGRAAIAPNTRVNAETREKMAELVSRIKESNDAGSMRSPEERAAMMKKLELELEASRVSAEEAEDVEDLGRELNESQKTPPSQRRANLRRKLSIPRSTKK
jgi:hypothetical protein